jgi:hypothetical protein
MNSLTMQITITSKMLAGEQHYITFGCKCNMQLVSVTIKTLPEPIVN